MPTNEQIEVLKQRLDAMRFTVFRCSPAQVPDPVDPRLEEPVIASGHRDLSADSTGWTTWDRLSNDERRAVLRDRIVWQGFDDQQKKRVIERVLRYGNSNEWFGGITPSLWTKSAAVAGFLKEQARIVGDRLRKED